ncbi:MAG: tetratricopeptide repeat protein [Aquificaceae bacterium]|nr:tetratricopeptide repeat protein [Aquificaceae bacterium]
MKGKLYLLTITLFSFVLSCGSITKEEFEKRTASLESRIAQLEEKQKMLEKKTLRAESRIDNVSESISSIRLELERLKLERTAPQETVTRIPEPRKESPLPKPQETPQPQETPSRDFQREYDEAVKLYNLKQLDQARDKFIDFIKKYPRTPLTDNAYFWLGLTYRDLGEVNKAEAVWLTLVERCQKKEMPDCNKAPSALLQLARLYEQKADNQKAKEFYEAILRDYPLSEEASTARARLGR